MDSTNLTQELIGLEKKYWNAMAEQDLQTAVSLTDFPCLVAGAQGVRSINQEQFEKMFQAHQDTIKEFHFSDTPQVRLLGPDTAIIGYNIRSTVTIDGQDRDCKAVDTSTWIRRGDQWRCAMHTEIETD